MRSESKDTVWQIVRYIIIAVLILIICFNLFERFRSKNDTETLITVYGQPVPVYSGDICYEVNRGIPFFVSDEISKECFLAFSDMDEYGRCGAAYACLGEELLPTEERGNIGMIKPSGWHTVRYDDIIEDKYLYNRCHLIAYMLCGENANELNLITGTRYFNINGMLPLENKIHDYIVRTGNHVMYRVTPIFGENNLLAYGVLIEALSVEDMGAEISLNTFVYNVQPHILIDYSNGESKAE